MVVAGVDLEGVVNIVGLVDSVDSEADNLLAAEAFILDLLVAEVDVLAALEVGEDREDELEEALADGLALGGVDDGLPCGRVGDGLPCGGVADGLAGGVGDLDGDGEDDLDEERLPRNSKLFILEPATQSVSKNLARSRMTFPLI